MDAAALALALKTLQQQQQAAGGSSSAAPPAAAPPAAAKPPPPTEEEGTAVAEEVTEIFSDYQPSITIGVGKGRQIAGIILDNIARGRRKHLWITTSGDLRQEAEHDFGDIGAPSVMVRDIQQLDEACKKAIGMSVEFKDPPAGMVLFLTYSMLTGTKKSGGRSISRVDQVVEWLGGDKWDGCIVFDEAHRAKNFKIGEKEENSTKMSLAVVEIQQKLPLARVVYASATGIESLDHMGYATRMGLWGNPSFSSFAAFHENFIKRGVGALELLAVEMKISSSFVSRSLSWKDAEFEMVDLDITAEQRDMYCKWSELFFDLKEAVDEAMKATGEGGAMKIFWSVQQRFFRDLINSFKVDYIVEECEREIADGRCVVIGLQSTGESGLNHALEQQGSLDYSGKQCIPALVSAPRESLISFLEKHFPTTPKQPPLPTPKSMEEIQSLALLYQAKGIPYDLQAQLRERAAAIEAQSKPPPTPQPLSHLIQSRDSMIQRIKDMDVPPSPLDTLIDRLGGPSKVAEMTGRRGRLVRSTDGQSFTYEMREQGTKTGGTNLAGDGCDSINIKERQAFMDGKKLVGIISDAASTGISLHASINGSKNQRRRVHLTLELGFSADKTLQQLGRTHRSHQSTAPVYKLLMTNLGGEKRFASAVARRLMSLGALTRGDRRAATVIDFSSLNFDSKSGGKALRRMMSNVEHITEEMLAAVTDIDVPGVDMNDALSVSRKCRSLIDELDLDTTSSSSSDTKGGAPVRRFLNRILMLPEAEQNLLFSLFSSTLEYVIRAEKQAGHYDEGTTNLRASSLRLVGDPELVWSDEGGTGAKVEAYCVETDRGVSFQAALEEYEKALQEDPDSDAAFWEMRGELYGKKLYLLAIAKATAPHLAIITRPNNGKSPIEMAFYDLELKYRRLKTPTDAQHGWDFIYDHTLKRCVHFSGCKVSHCSSGSRIQQVCIIAGAVVPIWAALDKTVHRYSANLTTSEAALRVVCTNLDDGRRLVGVKFPMVDALVAALKAEVKALVSENAGGASVIEAVTPVDPNMLRKAATKKRTMLSFFSKTTSSSTTTKGAASSQAVAPPPKRQKLAAFAAPATSPATVIDLSLLDDDSSRDCC